MNNWLQMLAGGQQQQPQAMDNPYMAQMALQQAQADKQRAQQMMMPTYNGGGASGFLAGILSMMGGKALNKKADETASEALRRTFEFETQAAQAAQQKAMADEDRKFQRELERDRKKVEEAAKNRAKTNLDYLPEQDRAKAARIASGLEVGAQAPQAPRQPTALEIQLQLAQQQGATPDQLRQMILGNSGPQAPAGYQATPDGKLSFIPGGPADPNRPVPVAGEQAARLAMAEVFLKDAPKILEEIKGGALTGPIDSAQASLGYGRAGEISRQLASGSDALLRNLTGAGMSEAEARKYVGRYQESRFDTAETLTSKVTQLAKELQAYKDKLAGNSVPTAQGAAGVAPAADYKSVMAKYGL